MSKLTVKRYLIINSLHTTYTRTYVRDSVSAANKNKQHSITQHDTVQDNRLRNWPCTALHSNKERIQTKLHSPMLAYIACHAWNCVTSYSLAVRCIASRQATFHRKTWHNFITTILAQQTVTYRNLRMTEFTCLFASLFSILLFTMHTQTLHMWYGNNL